MSWGTFWVVLIILELTIFAQGFAAWIDGYLTRKQMRVFYGYSFMEHGGMWADAFILSPLIAYLWSKLEFDFSSRRSFITLAVIGAASIFAIKKWAEDARLIPEAHTHDGETTIAGWIHGFYMVGAIWILVMFYFGWTTPTASIGDIIIVSLLLIPVCHMGVTKFQRKWQATPAAKGQVYAELAVICAAAIMRLSQML